jgi:hypothetical protein
MIEVLIHWLIFIAACSTFLLLAISAAAMPFLILSILVRWVRR